MATPTITIRLAPEHHALVKEIAARLKSDAALAGRLRAALQPEGPGAPEPVLQPVVQPSAPAPALAALPDVLARLDALEAAVAKLTPRKGRPPMSVEQRERAKRFAADMRAFAEAEGCTVAALADRLGALGVKRDYLIRYLRGERVCSPTKDARIRELLGLSGGGA